MIPERSNAGLSAKSVFFEEYNDIDIYIEDTAHGYVKLFTEIFSRLFEGEYKISNVFPLGGRQAVIDECTRWQGIFTRPSLYIVDGDMYLLTGKNHPELDGLYALPMYCIENMLIDENALIEILNEEDAVKLKDQIQSDFDFESWMEHNLPSLKKLYTEYAVCFDLCPDIQTVSYPISSLVSSNRGELDEVKVSNRVSTLKAEVIDRAGATAYYERYEMFSSKINDSVDSISKYISGKDCLIPLMLTRSRLIVNTKISNLNFKLRLAMKCDIEPLAQCKSKVIG